MTEETRRWFADDPIHGRDDDLLDRGGFLDQMGSLFVRLAGSGQSTVVGLIGAWGSGKSSLLAQLSGMLESRAKSADRWIVVQFNPWYYQDLASLQVGFFREVHAALPSAPSWGRARDAVADLGRSLAPFGGVLSLVGVDASRIIEGVASLVQNDQSVASQHEAATKELRQVGAPVLVVVDDVDRLDPPELLLLFKLIRLVGRLPNVHYLLAYDETTLLDALSRTGLVGGDDPRRAIDYLEKIVQVRVDVPPARDEQLSKWVDESLDTLAREHDLELSDAVGQRFSSAYFGHLRERLATPRGVKRYFAQVDAFLGGVRQEVDLVDFLVVSWIRAAEPLLYRALVQNRGRLLGDFSTRSAEWIAGKRDVEADRAHWERVLAAARVAPVHTEGVASLVGQLFPRFEHQWGKRNFSYSGDRANPLRVAHPDYFDRYFAFGVPAEDLSDQLVMASYEQIVSGRRDQALVAIEAAFPERGELILTKLEAWTTPGSQQSVEVLSWVARHMHRLPEHHAIADVRQRARWFGGRLYTQLDASQRARVFEAARSAPDGLQFFAFLSRAAWKHNEESQQADVTSALEEADARFATAISDLLTEQGDLGPLEMADEVWGLLWEWMRIDLAAARRWVRMGLQERHWPPIDLAARFVSVMYALGVKNPVHRTSDFDSESLERLLDMDEFATSLHLAPEDADLRIEREMPATPENRRLVARKRLAQLFNERGGSASISTDRT